MNWEVKRHPAYYAGIKQAYPHIKPGEPFFSRAVVAGNLIFLSAMSSQSLETGKVETHTAEEQTFVALDNVRLTMKESGSSMNNVIKMTILIKNLEDYSSIRKAEIEYYKKFAPLLIEEPPVSTFYQVRSLSKPEYLVEIEAIGVVSRGAPGWEVRMNPMYYAGTKQSYPNIHLGAAAFSRSVIVGNLVFCSSMSAQSLDTGEVETDKIEEQVKVICDRVKMNMEQAGGSLDTIIKTMTIMTNIQDYPKEQKTETEYYIEHAQHLAEDPPANTLIGISSLSDPKSLVALEVIGIVSDNRPGWKMKKYPAYYRGIKWAYPHVPPGNPAFSRSAVAGNLVFCSGCAGLALSTFKQMANDIEGQTVIALDKAKMYMNEVGCSMRDIVKTTIYLRNIEEYPRMRQTELEYYQTHAPALVGEPPASTLVVCDLEQQVDLLEIEVIAVIPE